MSFQFHALAPEQFEHLSLLSDEELLVHNAVRCTVTECPGAPCRISLEDAEIGEEVILVHHTHLPVNSPFASSHAIYVRKGVKQAKLEVGEVPTLMRGRLMSVRAFSANHMMVNADVVEGTQIEAAIEQMFSHPQADYIHAHYAKPGCFAARVTRA